MKKDRNCMGMPYPVYGAAAPMPIMPPQYMQNNQMMNPNPEYTKLENQINDLNNRVSRLEGMIDVNNNNKPAYNESNFYMV